MLNFNSIDSKVKNIINIKKYIKAINLIEFIQFKLENSAPKSEFSVTLKTVFEYLEKSDYLKANDNNSIKLCFVEEFNEDWTSIINRPENKHVRVHILSFLILLKFAENMEYFDVEKKDLKDL